MNVYKGRMQTKIELTLEQSQQGVSNDVLCCKAVEGDRDEKEMWQSAPACRILKLKSAQIDEDGNPALSQHQTALKCNKCEAVGQRAQADQGSQIKMIQVKEMMQDIDLKNSKSKDKGSKSRSQSMNEQIHYNQDKTITRQSINVKRHIFNVIGGSKEFEERDLNIGGDC
ncbi:hypothetical protein Tco_0143612 [Tanacetum coccineum]